MAIRIYVGGLPYSASSDDVRNLFSAHGSVVSADVITDRHTGEAKGFGFVEMSSDAESRTAITALNGTMFGGRTLMVNEAKPREDRGGSRSGGGGDRGRSRW
jgi:RNA recognition motif-containing protein